MHYMGSLCNASAKEGKHVTQKFSSHSLPLNVGVGNRKVG